MTSGIIEILTDHATVRSEVGRNKANDKWKVYPTVCPQPEDQPYIVVSKTSNSVIPATAKDCVSTLDNPTYEIICYAKNFKKSEDIAEAVRAALDGVASITAVCEFRRIWMDSEREAWSNDLQLYAHVMAFSAEQVRPVL